MKKEELEKEIRKRIEYLQQDNFKHLGEIAHQINELEWVLKRVGQLQ